MASSARPLRDGASGQSHRTVARLVAKPGVNWRQDKANSGAFHASQISSTRVVNRLIERTPVRVPARVVTGLQSSPIATFFAYLSTQASLARTLILRAGHRSERLDCLRQTVHIVEGHESKERATNCTGKARRPALALARNAFETGCSGGCDRVAKSLDGAWGGSSL